MTHTSKRTALVTGASRGLGAATARRLARLGWRLVLSGRDAVALSRLAAELPEAEVLVVDLAREGALEPHAAALEGVDAVVHAAAAFAPYTRCEASDPRVTRDVVAVNLDSAHTLARLVLPGMSRRGFGRLVFVGSLVGELGGAGQAAYAAAKAGLVGLARSLAVEAGPRGVTANLVELGLFDTQRTRAALDDATRAALVAATPAGRLGDPDEAAAAIGFLLSNEAAFVNGAILPVTGGLGLGLPRGAWARRTT